ncbi:hypothetical protein R5W24_001958 [Gemmata sp. JC717]|uniref:hypothetical protein n=1 Tax=Gemmata algarum TaxID=2975278 RepID=UPI0021BBAF22|nr:hypothetical protein [Gemmata algarum]MDY3552869.1 hypothetical protein [Gemmata algarum]
MNAVDAQCATVIALTPPNHELADENLRAYTMLLSAHWQGYCRDLHTECVQIVAAATPPAMQLMVQRQCLADRQLDGANPSYETIRRDFERFDFDLTPILDVNPANPRRRTHLDHLNKWRNYSAHHKTTIPPTGGPFTLAAVRAWKTSCDELAAELDGVMYNQLQTLTGAVPW